MWSSEEARCASRALMLRALHTCEQGVMEEGGEGGEAKEDMINNEGWEVGWERRGGAVRKRFGYCGEGKERRWKGNGGGRAERDSTIREK